MQTLYTNGTILTMEHPEDKPEALLVEDGRIAERFPLNKATLPKLKLNFGFAEIQ